jgi:hypothetical protein
LFASRDTRDPEQLGNALLAMQKNGDTLAQTYDVNEFALLAIPTYDANPIPHHIDYQRELEQRSAQGDKYAQSLLDSGKPFEEGADGAAIA